MRVLLVAAMLALAAVGFVALAAEPAAAQPPCDLDVRSPPNCCIWWGEQGIYWEYC